MQNVVEATLHVYKLRDIVFDEAESGMTEQMVDVGEIAGNEIVHAEDLVALLEKPVAKMASEKSGSAGNQSARHGSCRDCEWEWNRDGAQCPVPAECADNMTAILAYSMITESSIGSLAASGPRCCSCW